MKLNGTAQIEERQSNSWKTEKFNSQTTEQANFLAVAFSQNFLVSAILMCFCDSFVSLDGTKGCSSC
jgi:hypothetical protein